MFDTVLGLPVHALVMHATVVLLPLMSLLTVAVAFVPRLRALRLLIPMPWLVVLADAGIALLTFVTRQSGEALQERLGRLGGEPVAVDHGNLGRNLIWFALALLVASVLVALADGNRRVPAGLLAAVVAAATLFWTVRTGHTGSEAVWSDLVSSTDK